MTAPIKTRFAPSPTGYLHIGGARTALFAWLFARHHRGQFVLRIEDTDRERSSQASIDAILEGMAWLGLDVDEGPFYQSQRFDRYASVVEQLLAEGKAYRCYCTKEELDALREAQQARGEKPRYDGRYRDYQGPPREGVVPVIRFKTPLEGEVTYRDLVYGPVTVANGELDDLVIMRGDGTPTYNFCVVVDDADMGISHVIRGDDHINNTPRQINIYHALGLTPPQFAHVPMILGDDGKRLSKRHGATSVLEYRDEGYIPEAVLNYLARLGWSHGDQEIFSRAELVELFDLDQVNRAASTFNTGKLLWLNQHYLKHTSPDQLVAPLEAQLQSQGVDPAAGPDLAAVVAAFAERSQTFKEMAQQALFLYRDFEAYDPTAAAKHLTPAVAPALAALKQRLAEHPSWEEAALQGLVKETAKTLGMKMGQVGMPLRVALCGGDASPGLGTTLALLGPDKTQARLARALAYLEDHAAP
ncbi:MAG: glutamate--tRNA ligase [Candidatus Competibacterales bacterium]